MSLALRVLAALFICLSVVPLAHAQQRAEEVRFTHAGVQADAKRYETYLKANWQPKGSGAELQSGGRPPARRRHRPARRRARLRAGRRVRRQRRGVLDRARPRPARHQARPGRASATTCPSTPRAPPGPPTSARRRLPPRPRRCVVLSRGPQAPLLLAPGHRRAEGEPDASSTTRRCARPTTRWSPSTASASSSTRSMPRPPSRACASSSPSAWRRARSTGRSTSRSTARTRRPSRAEARQICLDGLAHGKRYEVQVREGLPSAIAGEKLLKTAELAVYVKDRSRLRARHGPRLRAAQPRPAGHPARHRQHRQGQRRGLPHRRPQPRADRCRAATSPSRSPPTTSPT